MKSNTPERAAVRLGIALQIKTADKIKIVSMMRKVNVLHLSANLHAASSTIPESRG